MTDHATLGDADTRRWQPYRATLADPRAHPRTWLVTGVAGRATVTFTRCGALGCVYNVGTSVSTTLIRSFAGIRASVSDLVDPFVARVEPRHRSFRPGDMRHSRADVWWARTVLGNAPEVVLDDGLARTVEWFVQARGPATT